MNKVCSVCGEGYNSPENSLFICEGRGCHVGVHQACYGIVSPPTSGVWYCRKCESQERAARVKCDLCPKKDGAFKRTDTGGWAHVVCALYIPEASFGNNTTMEPIVVSKIPKDRFTKACCICEEQGSESQAMTGACMTCNKLHCRLAFHVTCAQKARLLSEEEDPRDPNNVLYVGYCSNHYGKQEKQSYSSLRRQSVSQNLSPAPSSPLPSPFPTAKKETNLLLMSSQKTAGKTFAKRDRDILDPPARRRVKRRKLSSSTESNASEGIAPLVDSVEDTDSVKQPLNNEDFSSTGNTSHANSSSSSNNSRNPSISTVEIPNISPKSDEFPIALETEDKQETDETISTREQSLAPVEQEIITAETVEENVDVTTAPVLDNDPPIVNAVVAKKVVCRRRKKSVSALPARGGSTVPRRRSTVKQRNMSVSQNKAAKKNASSTSPQQSLVPPTSLLELLQRQWEQTAQFVMDQSSRQSNAGTMLSRLYQLQTENQQMQERITNLAAQREFLLATNSQLGSIITESQQHQQHTTNGLSEPTFNMSVETTDIITSTRVPTPPPSSSSIPSTTTLTTSSTSLTTGCDTQISYNSVLVQASNYPSIDSPSMFSMPPTNVTSTVAMTTSSEVTRSPAYRSKEVLPSEKKKQRNVKHSKQSSKLQQHLKANPTTIPGTVNVLPPPPYSIIKTSEGGTLLPPQHSSSILMGSLIPLEAAPEVSRTTSDLIVNPQVTLPPSRITAPLLPPFSEIAMELNGRTVTLSRDITAVTSAIGGPIPAMSPVASGYNVVR